MGRDEMKKFLTEYWASNEVGRLCKMGGELWAKDLAEAEERAAVLGQEVLGEWLGDVEWEGADDFCDEAQRQLDEAWLKGQDDGP